MALEESFLFPDHEGARDFMKFLKTLGISSRVRVEQNLDFTIIYYGKYSDLIALIDELREKEDEDDLKERNIAEYAALKERLQKKRQIIQDGFAQYEIGTTITGLQNLQTGSDLSPEETRDKFLFIQALICNNLISVNESGFSITKKEDPDQMIMQVSIEEIPGTPDKETISKYNIKEEMRTIDFSEHVVTTGPDIIFLEDLKPVIDYLEEHNEEDEQLFSPNMYLKHAVIDKIGELIDEGICSKEEIETRFEDMNIERDEDDISLAVTLSPEYINSVIEDLKKLGVLKGKDQKLKIAR